MKRKKMLKSTAIVIATGLINLAAANTNANPAGDELFSVRKEFEIKKAEDIKSLGVLLDQKLSTSLDVGLSWSDMSWGDRWSQDSGLA